MTYNLTLVWQLLFIEDKPRERLSCLSEEQPTLLEASGIMASVLMGILDGAIENTPRDICFEIFLDTSVC